LPGGATATVTGSNFNVTENNPNLNPFRAKTADLSFEWYYTKGGCSRSPSSTSIWIR
jgi:outer membrane receptor protein involved in Fe transport